MEKMCVDDMFKKFSGPNKIWGHCLQLPSHGYGPGLRTV